MANSIQEEATLAGGTGFLPGLAATKGEISQEIYNSNQHRIYAFAFWMTDNELKAEELMERAFLRAFAISKEPTEEMLDRTLIAEIRQSMRIGQLSLECGTSSEVQSVRHNVKRVDLERAVIQLPETERLIYLMHDGEGYAHTRIARTLGMTELQCRYGLHQARLRLRELLAN